MRNLNSKKLSILVALVMMISMVAGMSVTAQASANDNVNITIDGTYFTKAEITQSDENGQTGVSTAIYTRVKKNNVKETFKVTGITVSKLSEKFLGSIDPASITVSSPDNTHNPGTPYVKTINRPAGGWDDVMLIWEKEKVIGNGQYGPDLINDTFETAVKGTVSNPSPANQWVKNVTIMTTN